MDDMRAVAQEGAGSPGGLDPVAVFAALGSAVRWPMLVLLADGTPRTATHVAAVLRRDFDGVSKHLRLMREAGVVEGQVGEDRRQQYFAIPPARRREPGVLDYGVCVIRLPGAGVGVGTAG